MCNFQCVFVKLSIRVVPILLTLINKEINFIILELNVCVVELRKANEIV